MKTTIENKKRLLLLADYLKQPAFNQAHSRLELAYSEKGLNIYIGSDGKFYSLFPFVILELPNLFQGE